MLRLIHTTSHVSSPILPSIPPTWRLVPTFGLQLGRTRFPRLGLGSAPWTRAPRPTIRTSSASWKLSATTVPRPHRLLLPLPPKRRLSLPLFLLLAPSVRLQPQTSTSLTSVHQVVDPLLTGPFPFLLRFRRLVKANPQLPSHLQRRGRPPMSRHLSRNERHNTASRSGRIHKRSSVSPLLTYRLRRLPHPLLTLLSFPLFHSSTRSICQHLLFRTHHLHHPCPHIHRHLQSPHQLHLHLTP
jgi:hypothetical protein